MTAPPADDRVPRRWPVLAIALAAFTALIVMAAAVLVVGRHGVAVAAQVRRVFPGPGSIRLFRPGPNASPFFADGPTFAVQNIQSFGALILVLLLIGAVGLGLAVLCLSPWLRGRLQATTTRWSGRGKRPKGSNR